ncbi:hypothetical protein BDB00DRAFT_26385 [Zychaea mexicana]|uniref:uncharacterized protein n=1 Tax=Zychaea mexicana TaxID=64656 RepID=UPI0022FF2BB1|nr:uncharacterized protein BDB00DRAFT_26385 [Zychaea mexicana]KAI9488860.1 hypothetical protein BDB00DRAFT_26385 [Zychaea mexicana]
MDATTASPAVTTTANNNNTNNELITTHNPTTNSHTNGSTSNNINNHNHNHNHNDSDVPAPPSSTAASTPAASTPPANSNVNANNNNDVDETLQHKYGLLKKRVREIEEDNDAIHIKLTKAMRQIKRLRVERIVLLEELDSSRQYRRERKAVAGGASDSEGSVSDTATTTTKDQGMLKAPATKRARGGKSKLSSKHHHNKHDVNGDAVAASSTPGPARKKRDPNAPKGPGNVFFLYCRLERDNIKDQLSSDNLGEATRLLGQKWKALSKDEKKVCVEPYKDPTTLK